MTTSDRMQEAYGGGKPPFRMLNQVLGPERFPVNIEKLALDYLQKCFPHSSVAKIVGEKLPGFEGLLNRTRIIPGG